MTIRDRTSSSKIAVWLGFLFAASVVAFNIFLALRASPLVPVVDGWAVLSRIMHFDAGEMSWPEYLFRPHGAHLHFIAYLVTWIDYHFAYGQEKLTRIVSLGATTLYCAFLVSFVIKEALRNKVPATVLILASAATAAIVTGISDHETMMHPFQVVLSVARLSYIVLLWALIRALAANNARHYFVVIAISMLAVTFHGTGYLFAVSVILVHGLVCRKPRWLVFSMLPLLSAMLIQSRFSVGGTELSNLGSVLNAKGLFAFLPSVSAFFVVPFGHWMPVVGMETLIALGFALFLFTSVVTVVACLRVLGVRSMHPSRWWAEIRQKYAEGTHDQELVLFAIMGLVVLMSAFAAALFWIVRTNGSDVNNTPYRNIFAAVRYGATASIAYVMLIIFSLRYISGTGRKRGLTNVFRNLSISAPLLILLLGVWTSLITMRFYHLDDELHIAVAGTSTGVSSLQPEADAFWPRAKEDWYWADELPFAVRTMRAENKGPWRNLVSMGTAGAAGYARYPIEQVIFKPIASDMNSGRCSFSGTIPSNAARFSKSSLVRPVSTTDGLVNGYAVLTRQSANLPNREVHGFVLCPNGITGLGALFVGQNMDKPVDARQSNASPDLRGFGAKAITPLSIMKGSLECKLTSELVAAPSSGAKVVLTIRNLSDFDWKLNQGKYPLRIGVHYRKPDGTMLQWDNGFRIPAGSYISTGEAAQIPVSLASLNLKGIDFNQGDVVAEFALVQDGNAWFDNIACTIPIKR